MRRLVLPPTAVASSLLLAAMAGAGCASLVPVAPSPPLPGADPPVEAPPPLPAEAPALPLAVEAPGPRAAETVAGAAWKRAPTRVTWSGRDGHCAEVFRGRIFVFGGWDSGSRADVWSSADAADWTEAPAPPWPARKNHACAVFRDRLWLFGGSMGVLQGADVWSSADGETWSQEVEMAPWAGRNNHAVVVLDDHLLLLGGWGGANRSDVWSSTDGQTWRELTSQAPWSPRNGHAAVVFQGRLWVLGGWGGKGSGEGNLDDVWSSADGQTWQRELEHAPWSPRNGHAAVVHGGRLWVLGGWGEANTGEGNLNDVWSTPDGRTWVPATSQAPWLPRNGHAAVSFQDRLHVLGGWSRYLADSGVNDVWVSQ